MSFSPELPMPSSTNELPSEYEILLAIAFAEEAKASSNQAYERYTNDSFRRNAQKWEKILTDLNEKNGINLNQQHIRWWAWHQQGLIALRDTPVPSKK